MADMLPSPVYGANAPATLAHTVTLRMRSASLDRLEDVKTKLLFADEAAKSRFLADVGAQPVLTVSHCCIPQQLLELCKESESWISETEGDVYPLPSDRDAFAAYADDVHTRKIIVVVAQQTFTLLMYPPSGTSFDFLRSTGVAAAGAALRFQLRPALPALLAPQPSASLPRDCPKDGNEATIMAFERLYAISREEFFSLNGRPVAKNAFLFLLPEHKKELEFLSLVLVALGVKIYTCDVPGAWNYFLDSLTTGIVIFHPTLMDYGVIPRLRDAVSTQRYLFWQIEPKLSRMREDRFVKLFPAGFAVLITDDVIEHDPQKALETARMLYGTYRHAPRLNTSKLVGRPRLRAFTLDLCVEHDKRGADFASLQT